MVFRIKNVTEFPVNILGIKLRRKETVDLTTLFSNQQIIDSLTTGELYDRIQGRQLSILSPLEDWKGLGMTTAQYSRLVHAGFFQGYLSLEEIKDPLSFSADGYLNINIASTNPTTDMSVRGIVADGGVADGFPVEIGGIDFDGNIQTLAVDEDGYLLVSATVESLSEIEGRVFDGEIGTGIKPVIISGIDEDGYSQSMLISGDGEVSIRGYDAAADAVRTFETAPVNTTFLLEELVDDTNQAVDTYYYTVTMDNYKDLSLEFELSTNATMTVEISNDALFTTPKDITLSGNELVSNTNGYISFSNSDGIVDFDNLNVTYVRVVLDITNATNSAKIVARKKAL